MENKELLLEAIDDYDPYSKTQKKLLSALVTLAAENSITLSINSLSKLLGVTRTTIYTSIEGLEKDNSVRRMNIKQARVNTFVLNSDRLNQLITLYQNKQRFISNNQ